MPGPAGGYRLARPPERISLLDIVLAVEGPQPAFRCGEIRQRGPGSFLRSAYVKPCGINAAMLRAEKAYRATLANERLSEVLAQFMAEADPRSVAAACAFVARHQRPQKSSSSRQLKGKIDETRGCDFFAKAPALHEGSFGTQPAGRHMRAWKIACCI